MVKISNLAKGVKAQIFAKLEFFNPLSSVKDRIAWAMIEDARSKGLISKETVIIEPTSGNTGIGLAFICAYRGYKLTVVMPEDVSLERRKIMQILGAEIILTPAKEGMQAAVERARCIAGENNNMLLLDQFKNPANPEIHRQTTGPEIWQDIQGKVDIFVAGVGTGGTITGVGEFLKEKNSQIKIVAVEPQNSAVLSGGSAGRHKIQGIGAGFVPEILNRSVIDEVIAVSDEDAREIMEKLAREEGIFAGISSGAAMSASLDLAGQEENAGKNIVVIFPDTAERYLSLGE